MTSTFWDSVLEDGETLLWTGRPRPTFWNGSLIWPFGVAAFGVIWIPFNTSVTGQIWLDAGILFAVGIVIAYMVLRGIEIWTMLRQTRYALTDRRALFFRIGTKTKVRAFDRTTFRAPQNKATSPPTVLFIAISSQATEPKIGFEYLTQGAEFRTALAGVLPRTQTP